MRRLLKTRIKYLLMAGSVFLICWVALIWRLRMPYAGMQARGLLVWVEILFLLILYGYVLLSAYGLGHFFLRLFEFPLLSKAESALLAFVTGLGVFSLGMTIVGVIGWLNTPGILIWMAISGSVAFRELLEIIDKYETQVDSASSPTPKSRFESFLQVLIFACVPLQLIGAVSPVWDYDALMYHLELPRQFLAEGRIYFNPELWRSAYPLLGEMPSIVGIVFKLESLGKLVNLAYAVLLIGSVYVFSLRFLGRPVAYTATAILIGAPAFLLWATWIGIDFAWASYEFWSIYAICLWLTDDHRSAKWLVLAGAMSGWAASVKYLSIPTLLIVGAMVAWKSMEDPRRSVRGLLTNLLIFGVSAGLVMGIWYAKNWLWTGNPIYPMVFGGPGWEPIEGQFQNEYILSFGVGKSWLDYLLLPFNVYAYHNQFSTIPLEIIHPALWLSFFFPFVMKGNKVFHVVLFYAALYFMIWAVTLQVVRFLIPLSAFAAILAASVIERFPLFLKHLLKFGLLGGLVLIGFIQQFMLIQNTGMGSYLIGQKSAAQFLSGINNDFDTILYIQDSLAPTSRVLFLWDGRGYYCAERCIPDDEQSTAIRLSIDSPAPQKLARDLNGMGVTHLLLSVPDASWFIFNHDPRGWHQAAYDYFAHAFLPACGKLVFQDEGMQLFELTCE